MITASINDIMYHHHVAIGHINTYNSSYIQQPALCIGQYFKPVKTPCTSSHTDTSYVSV